MQEDLIEQRIRKDIDDIANIRIVPVLLDVICRTTKMGFAAIARVTEDRWITCGVEDKILFGLKPGDELKIETTICNEIRQRNQLVVIDHVAMDPVYKAHHTPAMYGFQSYISIPILRMDGSFFGTLCAIDPYPNKLNTPEVIGMFELYSELISFHLKAIEDRDDQHSKLKDQVAFNNILEQQVQLRTRELSEKNIALEKLNRGLESFAFISSHDLQEPLRKIETYANIVIENEAEHFSPRGKVHLDIVKKAAQRMRNLLTDLLNYSYTLKSDKNYGRVSLANTMNEIATDLQDDLDAKNVQLEVESDMELRVIPFQFR